MDQAGIFLGFVAGVAEVDLAELGELLGEGPVCWGALLAPEVVGEALGLEAGLVAEDVEGALVVDVEVVSVAGGRQGGDGVDDVDDGALGALDVVVVQGLAGLEVAVALVEVGDVDGLFGAVFGLGVAVDPGLVGVVLELGEVAVLVEQGRLVEGGVGEQQVFAGAGAGGEVAVLVPLVGAAVGLGQAAEGVVIVLAAVAGVGEVAEGVVGKVAAELG